MHARLCFALWNPLKILSDQDPAFESKLFQELMCLLGLKKHRTAGYNPRSNGLVKQANQSVKEYLTAILTQSNLVQNHWDRWLLEMSYSYNTSVHSTTNFTPCELMFGRHFRIPIDILYGTVEDKYNHTSMNTFARQLALMYEIARNNIGMKQIAYKTYYDTRVIESKLNVNDRVYVYMPRLRHVKLVNKWHGLFRVIEALDPVYIMEILTNHGIVEKAIPRDRLKKTVKYIEPEEIDLAQQNVDRSNSNGASDQAVNLNYDFSDSDDSDLENKNVVGQGE